MAGLYWLLLVPVLVPAGLWFISFLRDRPTLSPVAVLASIVVGCLVMTGMWQLGRYSQMADTEIWNGQVTGKQQVRVSCGHSYECFCTTDRDGNRTCQTCYEHSNDYDWRVYTTVGNLNISRIDRQGTRTPPRWRAVQIGEPASTENRYTNYVQAVPQSLYNMTAAHDESLPAVPDYPRVYDYYRINRVLTVGANYAQADALNTQLGMALRTLGPEKEANVIVIVANTPDQMYRYKVESEWIGGNKNDVIVLLGTNAAADTLLWVDVITFAKNTGNELFQVTLRDELLDGHTLDATAVAGTIGATIEQLYDRPHMADYEYLKDAIQPPFWLIVLATIMSLVGNFIAAMLVTAHEDRRGISRGRFGGYNGRRW